jgi:hypothetical protein
MIIERFWDRRRGGRIKDYRGWFLFGIIPLYIKATDWHW